MIEREPELLLLFMEFWAYGVRDPQVRPKLAARFAHRQKLADPDAVPDELMGRCSRCCCPPLPGRRRHRHA